MSAANFHRTNEQLNEVRQLLKLWARWLNAPGGGHGCRGYPTSVGFIHGKQTREASNVIPVTNHEANRVERALCKLMAFDFRAFRVLVYQYHLHWSHRDIARQLKVGEATVRNYRANGEYYLRGKLFE